MQNWLLDTTSQAVDLSFYLGDPDKGGTLISALDVSSLPKGVYLIGLSTANYRQHTKLLVD